MIRENKKEGWGIIHTNLTVTGTKCRDVNGPLITQLPEGCDSKTESATGYINIII